MNVADFFRKTAALPKPEPRSVVSVAVAGFSAGFFLWAVLAGSDTFRGFIIQNILSPGERTRLLLFLIVAAFVGLIIWTGLSVIIHKKSHKPLPAVLDSTSSWIFIAAILWFLPIVSIPALEVYYPFQLFAVSAAALVLVFYVARNFTAHRVSGRTFGHTESAGANAAASGTSTGLVQGSAPAPTEFTIRNPDRLSLAVIISCAAAYAIFFSVYTVGKHLAFHSYALDLGWYNQVFYTLLRKGWPFVTLHTTITHFSNHTEFLFYLLAPFYALYQNPVSLLIMQSLLLAAGAVPIYLLAKKKLNNNVLAVSLSVSFLLFPALHGLNTYDFHGLVLFIPLSLFMLYFFETDRKKLFWLFFTLALLVREDTPITLIGVGLYIFLIAKKRKTGLIVTAVSVVYFFAVTSLMTALEATENYTSFALPESPGFFGIFTTLITNPYFSFKQVFFKTDKLIFLFQLFFPVLFLPFVDAKKMIIAVPGFAILLLSGNHAFYSIGFQYSAHVIPLVFYLSIAGIEKLRQRLPKLKISIVAVTLLSASVLMSYEFGLVFAKRFPGIPAATERERTAFTLFNEIPKDAAVATNARLYPHLSGREMINLLFRIDDEIEYVLADLHPPQPALDLYESIYSGHALEPEQVRSIVRSLISSGDFGVVRYDDGFVLLQRGHDMSKNNSTSTAIRSLDTGRRAESAKIIDYFSDPADSIPEPFVSMSDALMTFFDTHRFETVLISVKDDATKRLSADLVKYLVMRGSKINTLNSRGSYAAVIHNNTVLYEEVDNRSAAEIDGESSPLISELFTGTELEIYSAGKKHGDLSSIRINGEELSPNLRGFNVVVLGRRMKVKEIATFDMWQKVFIKEP